MDRGLADGYLGLGHESQRLREAVAHGASELSQFGSAARGEMRPDSDIDFLVDFLLDARPGLLGVSAMTRELSVLLGRRVDLALKRALKPLIRPGVLAGARLIYAA